MNLNQPKILIAGAGGHLGKRIVELLNESGHRNLVAGSRNLQKIKQFDNLGIEVRTVDFNDREKLVPSFKNIDRLLLISTDELKIPGLRVQQHLNAISAAKEAGIKHIFYTSMPNPETSTDIPFSIDHVATEKALIESGLGYTILRVSWYCENLLAYLPQIISAGKWPTVAENGRIAFVPREDVARVTASALLNQIESKIYDITGSEALTVHEIAEIISEDFGKKINVEQLNVNEINESLAKIGIPEWFISTVVITDLNTKANKFNIVTDVIKNITGQMPQSLREFLNIHQASFVN